MIRASGDWRLWKKTTGDPLDLWVAVRRERPSVQVALAERWWWNLRVEPQSDSLVTVEACAVRWKLSRVER